MEVSINRNHAESLVRKITEEREKFLSAWHQGAGSPELNRIRENIQKLDDLLWETNLHHGDPGEIYRSGTGSSRDLENRLAGLDKRP